MTKRYLILNKRGDQREAFCVTVNSPGLKDLPKLSRRMVKKLLQGEKISRITVRRIPLDETES